LETATDDKTGSLGLLAPYWDDFAVTMFERGYSWYTVRRTIEIAKPFAAYAGGHGMRRAADLTDEIVDDYLKHRKLREGQTCLRLLMGFLRKGTLNPIIAPKPATPLLLEEYQQFLRGHRGRHYQGTLLSRAIIPRGTGQRCRY
jgi:hypothetical protein